MISKFWRFLVRLFTALVVLFLIILLVITVEAYQEVDTAGRSDEQSMNA